MKPRLLILTDPFAAPAYKPRLRFLCDYLMSQGWDINIYTERGEPIRFEHTYPIHEVTIYRTDSHIEWAVKSGWSLLTDWRNRYFSRQVQKEIADKQYDLVLCCTFSTFPLRAAYNIAQERHIPLHVDLRDVDEQVPGAQYQNHRQWWLRPFRVWYRNVNIHRRNRIIRQADSLTSVSPWHVDFLKQYNSNVHLVYNGFDAKQFYWSDVKSDKFLVSYVGKIYEFQDISIIDAAIHELDKNEIVLNIRKGGIATDKVGDEIRRSSVMIVLTSKAARGMMTTKFYEALGCEKPVLCFPNDEGVLATTIKQTNAGIATDDKEAIKAFILDKYIEWKKQGYTHQAVKNKSFFNRAYQSQQMERVISNTIAANNTHHTLVDICWTLFYSNTTYDFLHIRGNKFNSLIYKLFGYDIVRSRAIRKFKVLPEAEQTARVERFYHDYLEPRKIEQVWKMIEGKQIVLVSNTMDIIAKTVAKHIGTKKYYATQNKEEVLTHYTDFDIVTDNLTDIALIRHAKSATIITYNNRSRWEKMLPRDINVNFIDTNRKKY